LKIRAQIGAIDAIHRGAELAFSNRAPACDNDGNWVFPEARVRADGRRFTCSCDAFLKAKLCEHVVAIACMHNVAVNKAARQFEQQYPVLSDFAVAISKLMGAGESETARAPKAKIISIADRSKGGDA
jgi:hypothetical protein